jgi:hypothetical protein
MSNYQVSLNIGASGTGVINSYPIFSEFSTIRDFTDWIRNDVSIFNIMMYGHKNWISRDSLCLYVFIYMNLGEETYNDWKFRIECINIREYKNLLEQVKDLSREELDQLDISKDREYKIDSLIG